MKKLLLMFCLIFLMTFVTAQEESLGIFKQNSDILLTQVCSTCTYVNISYVAYPNNTFISALTGVGMTKTGVHYTYLLSGNYTSTIGRYVVCGYGDIQNLTTFCYDFEINNTGRETPTGSVLVFFIALFILLLYGMTHIFIYSLGHFIKKDFDMIDLAFSLGIYFALLGFYLFQSQYLGHETMDSILLVLVIVGAVTHVVGALIFFIATLIYSNLQQQRRDMGLQPKF